MDQSFVIQAAFISQLLRTTSFSSSLPPFQSSQGRERKRKLLLQHPHSHDSHFPSDDINLSRKSLGYILILSKWSHFKPNRGWRSDLTRFAKWESINGIFGREEKYTLQKRSRIATTVAINPDRAPLERGKLVQREKKRIDIYSILLAISESFWRSSLQIFGGHWTLLLFYPSFRCWTGIVLTERAHFLAYFNKWPFKEKKTTFGKGREFEGKNEEKAEGKKTFSSAKRGKKKNSLSINQTTFISPPSREQEINI